MIKKQLIMDKSLELFAEQGFSATSVQEITERCGISKGAFYLSFKSKDELILSLIDHFLEEIIADIDQVVRESDKKDLLYNYFYYNFDSFSQQSAFAKIFIKEQTHFINNEFMEKIYYYNELMQESILMMIDKIYGEKVKDIKYDMVYSVQGLMRAYLELFLYGKIEFDIELLSRSLSEKTDLLANHTKTPYITEELHQLMKQPQKEAVSTEELIHVLDETIAVLNESVEMESLLLLKNELTVPSMSKAVIKGLLENIKHHPNCKWASYLLKSHFRVE